MYPSLKNLTDKERLILQEFRESLSSILKPEHDDLYLVRWLKGTSFNKEKAEAMLRKHITVFQKQYGMDTILTHYQLPEVYTKYNANTFLGFDKEGCPVRLILANKLDVKGYLLSLTERDLLEIGLYFLAVDDKARIENNAKTGKWAEQNVYIVDGENIDISGLVTKENIKMGFRFLQLYLDNFPERVKYGIGINGPPIAFHFLKLATPFVPAEILSKLKAFGKEGWKEFLLEEMDPEILPAFLGGTRTDPDGNPRCLTMIPQGGIIPEEYYLANKERLNPDEKDVHSTIIDIKSSFVVEVPIEDADTVLFWKYQTEKFDLGFALCFKKNLTTEDKELEVLIPTKRENCSLIPVEGMYICQEPGVYVLQFDNSYSWMNEKKLLYKVEITLPNEIDDYLINCRDESENILPTEETE